jgi:hypothetical protein
VEFSYCVAEFCGVFEFEFLCGFAHVGFEVGDVGVEFLLGDEVGALPTAISGVRCGCGLRLGP